MSGPNPLFPKGIGHKLSVIYLESQWIRSRQNLGTPKGRKIIHSFKITRNKIFGGQIAPIAPISHFYRWPLQHMMDEPRRHCLKGASLALYANIWNVKVTLEGSGLKNEKLLIVCWKLQIFTKNEIHIIRTMLMKTVFCNRCQVPCTLHKQKIHQAIWTRCRKVTWKELWE